MPIRDNQLPGSACSHSRKRVASREGCRGFGGFTGADSLRGGSTAFTSLTTGLAATAEPRSPRRVPGTAVPSIGGGAGETSDVAGVTSHGGAMAGVSAASTSTGKPSPAISGGNSAFGACSAAPAAA